MTVELSRLAIQAFGALIAIASLWGLAAPRGLIHLVRNVAGNAAGFGFAVGIRIILGAALITASPASRFPTAFLVLGWIAILAAIGLLIMGPRRMQAIVGWVGRLSVTAIRACLVLGLAFGVLLLLGA